MKRFRTGKVPNSMRPKGARNKVFRAALEKRRVEAKARQAVTDKLTPQARLAALDAKLGVGLGAAKERQRLQDIIDGKVIKITFKVEGAEKAKDQLKKVTKAAKQFAKELKKVKAAAQRNPAAAPGVPTLPPLSTVVSRVG